jgi:hypothetical protein
MEEKDDNTKYYAIGFAIILVIGIGMLALQFLGVL